MKLTRNIIILLFVLQGIRTEAQQFINGSLEPSKSSTTVACADDAFYKINTIGHVWMTIVGPQQMYLANNTCGIGLAKDGNYYLGMHYSPTLQKGSQLLLELTSPMIAGYTYTFGFYYRGPKPKSGTGADLYYGYAADLITPVGPEYNPLWMGRLTILSDSIWEQAVVTVTPTINTSYIWVAVLNNSSPTDTATAYVDHFTFDILGVEKRETNSNNIKLYPDPVYDKTLLELTQDISMPCQIAIYDLAGKEIRKEAITTVERKLVLDCTGYAKGMYFIKLIDKENRLFVKRLVVQ